MMFWETITITVTFENSFHAIIFPSFLMFDFKESKSCKFWKKMP